MVEAAAEGDEELLDKFLERRRASDDEIRSGCAAHAEQRNRCPMCGSAFKNKGVQAMLDAVIDFMPSPIDVPAITGIIDDESEGERARG